MKIFIFGNPDIKMDSLPIKLLPELQKQFSGIDFLVLDPNEEWDIPEDMLIIDTVVGIHDVIVFDDLSHFVSAPRFSVHDFDAYANLRLLQKIGKLKRVKIIGVPVHIDRKQALQEIAEKITNN